MHTASKSLNLSNEIFYGFSIMLLICKYSAIRLYSQLCPSFPRIYKVMRREFAKLRRICKVSLFSAVLTNSDIEHKYAKR